MPTIEPSPDTALFYRDWGTGKPVLFCSGWALSSSQWQYQMTSVTSSGLRAIAYDRRGHGRSDDPGHGYDYDTLADDLATLIDHLDLTDLTLVGHSMGSGEIIRYLSRHGSARVSGIVLLGTTLPFSEQTDTNPLGIPGEMLDAVRGQWAADLGHWIEENEAAYFGDGLPGCATGPVLREWTRADLLQTSLRALIEFSRLGAATDFREELRDVHVPTLLIHGDRDASSPLEISAQPTVSLLPDATLSIYRDAPHALYLTHKALVNHEIVAFVDQARSRSAIA